MYSRLWVTPTCGTNQQVCACIVGANGLRATSEILFHDLFRSMSKILLAVMIVRVCGGE